MSWLAGPTDLPSPRPLSGLPRAPSHERCAARQRRPRSFSRPVAAALLTAARQTSVSGPTPRRTLSARTSPKWAAVRKRTSAPTGGRESIGLFRRLTDAQSRLTARPKCGAKRRSQSASRRSPPLKLSLRAAVCPQRRAPGEKQVPIVVLGGRIAPRPVPEARPRFLVGVEGEPDARRELFPVDQVKRPARVV